MQNYLMLLLAIFAVNSYAEIVGKANVTDGDTIVINDIRIRFTGSDAPESYFFGKTQTCFVFSVELCSGFVSCALAITLESSREGAN